jgi:hypothetical protein
MRMTVQDAANPFPHPVLSLTAPHSLVIDLLCWLMFMLTLRIVLCKKANH